MDLFSSLPAQSIFWTLVFSTLVLVVFLFEYRRIKHKLFQHEEQMRRRMYELAILRELGDRIGYSLNVEKIIDIISGSLGNLLPYSTVAYMLPLDEGRLKFDITLAESVDKAFIKEVRARMLKSISALFTKTYDDDDIDESVSGVVTDPMQKYEVKSFFNVPIVINEKPAGIVTVASFKSGLYKTSEEVEILYTIVNQASEAVSKLQIVLEIEKGKLNSMVASMADGVLMVDTKNQVLVINPATVRMLGLEKREDLTIFDVYDVLADKLALRIKIEESLKEDQLIIIDEVSLKNHFFQILINPVKDKKGGPLGSVVLFHDITHEKDLEKMREDFTSMMVHELRSPLTGIRSIATLLHKKEIKTQENKYNEFIDLISSNSNSMLDLVNDLLDVAKMQSGKFQVLKIPGDIKKVIHLRIESFRSLAQENKLELVEFVSPDVPETLAFDENKIAQVLNNLLSNAIKFTGEGGKIVLSAFFCNKGQNLSAAVAEHKLSWPGAKPETACLEDSVVISVADTGVGIPKSEIPKLFNKFQQLSSAKRTEKKGTGLGLVIVKGVVEAHGGRIGIFSEEEKGTVFYLTLPVNFEKQNGALAKL